MAACYNRSRRLSFGGTGRDWSGGGGDEEESIPAAVAAIQAAVLSTPVAAAAIGVQKLSLRKHTYLLNSACRFWAPVLTREKQKQRSSDAPILMPGSCFSSRAAEIRTNSAAPTERMLEHMDGDLPRQVGAGGVGALIRRSAELEGGQVSHGWMMAAFGL